jgi:pyrimidine operon attenuation protein/uracil phosphoribosyltransferase
MTETSPFLQHEAILDLIEGMAQEIGEGLTAAGIEQPAMVGIHTGGVWIAQRLHQLLGLADPLGTLDISFYRDDLTRVGMNPEVKPSKIPFDVDGRHIILVDDVLQTGRTVRAALNEIFDWGRPASVMLVALIERGGRELPIEARVVGLRPTLREGEHVILSGPDPLELQIATSRQRKRG